MLYLKYLRNSISQIFTNYKQYIGSKCVSRIVTLILSFFNKFSSFSKPHASSMREAHQQGKYEQSLSKRVYVTTVWNFGEKFQNEMRFGTSFCFSLGFLDHLFDIDNHQARFYGVRAIASYVYSSVIVSSHLVLVVSFTLYFSLAPWYPNLQVPKPRKS